VSAALDALDRGVIEAGVTAAEAIARVAALEAAVAELRQQFGTVYRLGLEHGERRRPPRGRATGPRHLSPVPRSEASSDR
jgi:hypothetical protein